MAKPRLKIMTLPHFDGLDLPSYQSKEAAGLDLQAATPADAPMRLKAHGGRALVPTGFCMALEQGFEAQIRPRSGLAYKHGVSLLNTPGTIDSDYRGYSRIPTRDEIKIWLDSIHAEHSGNHGKTLYLMCRTVIEVGLRGEENLLLRANQIPDPKQIAPDKNNVRVEIIYGTKGGAPDR